MYNVYAIAIKMPFPCLLALLVCEGKLLAAGELNLFANSIGDDHL